MTTDRFLAILGLLIGGASLVWSWVNYSKINTISATEMGNVHQGGVVTYNSGPDTYAIVKLAKELSQPEIESIIQKIAELQKQIDAKPNIHIGTEPLPEGSPLKSGDIYFQVEK